ncbi:unnamed protein product, partial [Choristocarpus tenellus]
HGFHSRTPKAHTPQCPKGNEGLGDQPIAALSGHGRSPRRINPRPIPLHVCRPIWPEGGRRRQIHLEGPRRLVFGRG